MPAIELSKTPIIVSPGGEIIDPAGGFETEYGYKATVLFGGDSGTLRAEDLLGLPSDDGYFFADGSRRYVDISHPEFCTPEEVNYLHAAYRVLIGHIIMANMCREGARRHRSFDVRLNANVTDGKGRSWGAHQSILAARALSPEAYIPALGAHNMSRIVWSGARYVMRDNTSPQGFRYCLSERADFIEKLRGLESTKERALVNTRDEPHASSEYYRRIHDISGDSVFSPRVMALKLATASMILRACGVGARFDDLLPQDAPEGMRIISRDPMLKVKVETTSGHYTGPEHQMKIFERTIGAIATRYMTPQDELFAKIWEEAIEMLMDDPLSEASMKQHDWVKKWSYIDRALQKPKRKYSDAETAQLIWLHYSQLLPKYGLGMAAIMNGKFTDSPPREMLEAVENGGEGLPLPETRAKLRGTTIARLNKRGIPHRDDWAQIEVNDFWSRGRMPLFLMPDPFATESETIEQELQFLKA